MRLSDESVMEGRHLTPEERIALQAEGIKQLQQENEQLKAQVARVKNAIQYVLYHLRRGGKSWIIDKLEPAISGTPADYHNPADVEALRKAREIISARDSWFECDRCGNMRDALAAIDKVIGGAEDGSSKDE